MMAHTPEINSEAMVYPKEQDNGPDAIRNPGLNIPNTDACLKLDIRMCV